MPPNLQPNRDRILKAATRLFAEHGFDGVSIRAIAAAADSQLALLHYHFGSKANLYRAVWENHYALAADVRRDALAEIDFSRPREEVVREIVRSFLEPPISMRSDPACSDFACILARETNDPKERDHGVVTAYLDPVARLLIAALSRAMPELSPADLAWGYQAMAGVSTAYMADSGRTARLSNNEVNTCDMREAMPRLIEFSVGGWLALGSAAMSRCSGPPKKGAARKSRISVKSRNVDNSSPASTRKR